MNLRNFEFKQFAPNEFFITGIGTGVGKTFTAAFIAKTIISSGRNVTYMKPVQTGKTSDIETIKKICPQVIIDKKFSSPYYFKTAASPHFAASCENRKIKIGKIIESFRHLRELYQDSILLVEGAGGIMVPLTNNFLFLDLIKKLKIPVILVSSPYLGAINHTLLSIYTLKKEKISISEVVFSLPSERIDKIAGNTIETIIRLSKIKKFSLIPYMPG